MSTTYLLPSLLKTVLYHEIERVNRQHVIINGQELSVSKSHVDDLFSALGLD